jgi:hypothetical protein
MIASFDRLNELNIKRRSIPYKQYFGEMELSVRDKERRVKLAEDIEDIMLLFFELLATSSVFVMIDWDYLLTWLTIRLQGVAARAYVDGDDIFIAMYPTKTASEIIEATRNAFGFNMVPEEDTTDPAQVYAMSKDRAMFVAENEANTLYNRSDYVKAKKAGKKYKTWITQKDSRVRKTHREIDNKKIPIDEFFYVGKAEMLYPKDIDNAAGYPEEYVNCRCTIKYS